MIIRGKNTVSVAVAAKNGFFHSWMNLAILSFLSSLFHGTTMAGETDQSPTCRLFGGLSSGVVFNPLPRTSKRAIRYLRISIISFNGLTIEFNF